ncbi:MAG: hypothetical protein IT507_00725 [Burkholderiaceae bacterium]|nr:hypothetical protein [Burkholderiaceae bacterium]
MIFDCPARPLSRILVAIGVFVTVAGIPMSAHAAGASANADSLLAAIRLPDGVESTPVLDGVHWQGFLLELVALEIPMTVEHFLAQLAAVVPERTLLSVSQGIYIVQWEVDRASITVHVVQAPQNRATGVLTAMRLRPEAASRVSLQTQCRDPVERHIAGQKQAHALFDLIDPADARIAELNGFSDCLTFDATRAAPAPGQQSIARIRGFVLNAGVDELSARLLRAMPRDGWTNMHLHASSRPMRSVSIETACGHRRLRMHIAQLHGRTTVIAFETDEWR